MQPQNQGKLSGPKEIITLRVWKDKKKTETEDVILDVHKNRVHPNIMAALLRGDEDAELDGDYVWCEYVRVMAQLQALDPSLVYPMHAVEPDEYMDMVRFLQQHVALALER